MRWNDSGAVAALHATETKNGSYTDGELENWEREEMSPVSVLDLSKKLKEFGDGQVYHHKKESCLLDHAHKQREQEKKPVFLGGDGNPKGDDGTSFHKVMDVEARNVDHLDNNELVRDDSRVSGWGDSRREIPSDVSRKGGGSSHNRMFLCSGWPIHRLEQPLQWSHVFKSVVPKSKRKPSNFNQFWKRMTIKVSRKSEAGDTVK